MYAIIHLREKYVFRTHKSPRAQKPYTCAKRRTTYAKPLTGRKSRKPKYADCYSCLEQIVKKRKKHILSITACSEQVKSTRVNRDWTNSRNVTAPTILEDLMEKEVQSSLEEGAISELSVLTDPANEDSTRIKQKIRILDHPKNLIEVLRARLAIGQDLTGNNITTGPNQYRIPEPSWMGKRYAFLILNQLNCVTKLLLI